MTNYFDANFDTNADIFCVDVNAISIYRKRYTLSLVAHI